MISKFSLNIFILELRLSLCTALLRTPHTIKKHVSHLVTGEACFLLNVIRSIVPLITLRAATSRSFTQKGPTLIVFATVDTGRSLDRRNHLL